MSDKVGDLDVKELKAMFDDAQSNIIEKIVTRTFALHGMEDAKETRSKMDWVGTKMEDTETFKRGFFGKLGEYSVVCFLMGIVYFVIGLSKGN